MNFTSLIGPFYNRSKGLCAINGKTSQADVCRFFIAISVGGEDNITEEYSDDYYRKMLTGDKPVGAPIWEMLENKFTPDYFADTLSVRIKDERVPELIEKFGINIPTGTQGNAYTLACAVASQLKLLAECKGEAENILDAAYKTAALPVDFSEYLSGAYNKYSKMKTLLYTAHEVSFDSFYVCNSISTERVRFRRRAKSSDKTIENADLDKLKEKGLCTIIVGMGGCGKSMMMRHLFLESVKAYPTTGMLPVMVVLRDFGEKKETLWEMLVEAVMRFDSSFSGKSLHRYMKEGKCQILLDGLDEVKPKDIERLHDQLDILIDGYQKCQFVMSTRKISSFIGFSQFTVLWMEPFSPQQSLELIDKLKYCEDVPELKEEFKKQLEEEYFRSHAEFASNPLLLTLMLMSYRRNPKVSDKKYVFYEEAYQTLLRRHDSDDKGLYTRPFNSVEELSDFTKVLMEFCAKSYRKGDIDYNDIEFEQYFEMVHAKDRMDGKMMTVENFKKDLLENVCLIYEEERRYHYLHRSFQEYFFAEYYSRADGMDLRKLEKYVREHRLSNYDDGYAFDMLYDLEPNKVEQFIFIPLLEYLFEPVEGIDEYWSFLLKGYGTANFTLVDKQWIKDDSDLEYLSRLALQSINEPLDVFLLLMYKINHLEPYFPIDTVNMSIKVDDSYLDSVWFGRELKERSGKNRIMPMGIPKVIYEREGLDRMPVFEGMIVNADGKPVPIAFEYHIEYNEIINNPRKYNELKQYIESSGCSAKSSFAVLKRYYAELKDKYANVHDMEDDDF